MGIYSRSLVLVLAITFFCGLEGIAQRRKKKNKNKAEVVLPLLNNNQDSISYALGMGMAENLMNSGMDTLSSKAFQKGVLAVFNSDSTLLSKEEVQPLLTDYFASLATKVADENLAFGRAFLVKNKLRPEVDTTVSGLQYEVLIPGEGAKPTATDQVTVHYEGTLLDGNIFDSSYERNKEIQFNLGQVIPGWTEGLQLMSIGAKYILYIPSELAYGARGAGADIPPNSTLIFTIELISID